MTTGVGAALDQNLPDPDTRAHTADLRKRLEMGGMMLGVAIIAIVLLMVFKPGS